MWFWILIFAEHLLTLDVKCADIITVNYHSKWRKKGRTSYNHPHLLCGFVENSKVVVPLCNSVIWICKSKLCIAIVFLWFSWLLVFFIQTVSIVSNTMLLCLDSCIYTATLVRKEMTAECANRMEGVGWFGWGQQEVLCALICQINQP